MEGHYKIMDYKLPRQIFTQDVSEIITREIEEQDIELAALSKKNLKELLEVSEIIKEKGLPDRYVLKKLKGDLGYGLFLKPGSEPIQKGELIAPYAGEVSVAPQNEPDNSAYAFAPLSDILLNKKEQNTFDKKRKFSPRRLYTLNLDAEKQGNFTRYINHSTAPNIEAEIFRVSKNAFGLETSPLEVFYRAKTKILPGQQLLVCYEDEEESYWKPFKIEPFHMTPKTFTVDASLNLIQNKKA
ncbi:MAG: hypothetical protein S4CHLAM7_03240 [Chlamydiae bacterium]|nr:hypothetical protein [Chlamydiota bacterium]